MKIQHLASFLICVLLGSVPASADVIPGRWEMVDALAAGTGLIVKLRDGERIECAFESSDTEHLIARWNGAERRISKSAVASVVGARRYNDPVWDGLATGMGVGAFSGMLVIGLPCYGFTGNALCFASWAAIGGGVGAGIGAALDEARKGREVLYRAPGARP